MRTARRYTFVRCAASSECGLISKESVPDGGWTHDSDSGRFRKAPQSSSNTTLLPAANEIEYIEPVRFCPSLQKPVGSRSDAVAASQNRMQRQETIDGRRAAAFFGIPTLPRYGQVAFGMARRVPLRTGLCTCRHRGNSWVALCDPANASRSRGTENVYGNLCAFRLTSLAVLVIYWPATPRGPQGRREDEDVRIVQPLEIVFELLDRNVTSFNHLVAELATPGAKERCYY